MGEQGPFLAGDEPHEDGLDFFWIGFASEAETARKAGDMGINDDADVLVKSIAENNIGGFAADAGEADKRVEIGGDFAMIFFGENAGGGADIFRLGAVKADGAKILLKDGGIGLGVGLRGAVFFETAGVTLFTCTSVHCAESMVATRSSSGLA